MIPVIEAIAIYHNIGKIQYKSFSASPHTQLSFSISQLLTLTQYLWDIIVDITLEVKGWEAKL